MNTTDWILIGTSLFLGGVALFAPYFAELTKRWWLGPKLNVNFALAPPGCLLTYWTSSSKPNLNEPVFYFRFTLTNNGHSVARQCQARLEGLWIYDASGKRKRFPQLSPVNLGVDPGHDKVDIYRHQDVFCAIGHISSPKYHAGHEKKGHLIDVPGASGNTHRFMLEMLQMPNSQPNALVPGKYAIQVSIYSENAPRQQVFFEINWTGQWRDTESDMFQQLTIRRISPIRD